MKKILLASLFVIAAFCATSSVVFMVDIPLNPTPRTPISGQPVRVVWDKYLRAGTFFWMPYTNSTTPTMNGVIDSVGGAFQLLSNGRLAVSKGLGTGFFQYYDTEAVNSLITASVPDSTVWRTVLNSFNKAQVNALIAALPALRLSTTGGQPLADYTGNLNSLSGTIGVFANSAATNKPGSGANGYCLQLEQTATFKCQIYVPNNSDNIYLRRNTSGVWTAWVRVYNDGSALTGYVAGANTTIAATDNILQAFGKVQGQITARALIASPTFTGIATADQFKLSALNTAPASATATGTLGEIRITAGFIYVCTASNTWVRSALATW